MTVENFSKVSKSKDQQSILFDSFKTQLLIVSKPKSRQSRYTKISIFDIASIKSLDLDSFTTQVSTVDNFLTVSKPKPWQSWYPEILIFDMVSIKSLDFYSFKTQVSTVKKFSTISKPKSRQSRNSQQFQNPRLNSQEISISFSIGLETSKPKRNVCQINEEM